MIGRRELLYYRSFGKCYIIFISGNNLVGIFSSRFLDHLEQGRLHFLTINNECSAEYLMAAMLGIDLREAEYFGIG